MYRQHDKDHGVRILCEGNFGGRVPFEKELGDEGPLSEKSYVAEQLGKLSCNT